MVRQSTWTSDQDRALQLAVERCNADWTLVAEYYNRTATGSHRTRKQCRARWLDHLDPGLIHGPFSNTERQRLFHLHQQHGNCWQAIAQQLPNRSSGQVKNEFYSSLRRGVRTYNKGVPLEKRVCRKLKSMVADKTITLVLQMVELPWPAGASRQPEFRLPSVPDRLF